MQDLHKILEDFSDVELVKKLQKDIQNLASSINDVYLMEVCGTHTMAISKFGIRNLLPENVHLVSGPGCPVCVSSNETIDKMVAFSKIQNVIIATFGDMMRVPGSSTSLLKMQAQGSNIHVVYSPLDALNLAIKYPDKEVIFIGIGFETTAPLTAYIIKQAQALEINNFSVYCVHKNMPGALDLLAKDNTVKINGFILPGHVCAITGSKPFNFLSEKYKIPGVISGFDVVDIMSTIKMLLEQIVNNQSKILNNYTRVVHDLGNINALRLLDEVFDTADTEWRGIGVIKDSSYVISEKFSKFDALKKFKICPEETKINSACRCGDILKGKILPFECPLFNKICNPQNPIGPCMVSSEGSCSAFYKYNIS